MGRISCNCSVENFASSLEADSEREPNPFDEWDYTCPNDQEDDILSEGVCDTISETSKESNASTDLNISEDGGNKEKTNLANAANPTPKFVDKKRKKHGETAFCQRDNIYMKIAKDDLILKQTMVKQLMEATVESNKAFEKLSASIDNVGNSIGDGLKLLANGIGNNNNQQPYDPRTPGFHHVADSRAQALFNQQKYPLHNNGESYSAGYHPNIPYPQINQDSTEKQYESL